MKRQATGATKPKEDKDAKYYWVPDAQEVWLPGMMMEDKGQRMRVLIGGERTVDVEKSKCREIADRSVIFETTDDLISLGEVNDSAILNSTRLRFSQKIIYTSIGSVLMAVNPFAKIEGLYSPFKIMEYENPREGEKSAHVYLIPSRAYDSMKTFGKNQSILISGESGAGKTEATKQCLAFITKVAGATSPDNLDPGNHGRRASLIERRASVVKRMGQLEKTLDHSNLDMTVTKEKAKADIAQRVIAASPILEAFGNAQTIRNPNSSRFGKWMELSFDEKNHITGSKITSYLLEKSRVTGRDPLERNYHVFYQLIRGGSDLFLDSLSLQRQSLVYTFLSNGDGVETKDLKDAENYLEMMEAFDLMGFPIQESEGLLKIVAAVLHMGNISFDSLDDGEASAVSRSAESAHGLTHSSRLLGVSAPGDLGKVLCVRTIITGPRKSITEVRLTPQKAVDTRDSLAKTLFDRVFKEIIVRINKYSKSGPSSKCIGLLDIFGFEIFKNNSFEQLCINYCNEMLQNHFNLVIFINEKNMYAAENITCDTIEFKDNHAVISAIEGSFKSLDEEAKIPKGSSKTWYDKMKRKGAPTGPATAMAETVLTFPTTAKDSFVVTHYAGPVSYLPDNFMEKNIDTLNSDLLSLMNDSTVEDIRVLFADPEAEAAASSGKKPTIRSIAWHFQAQLSSLMTMLASTESHFIRCVKSNDACRPMMFDSDLVHRQLVYSGVFEVVKIQQSGLPFRFIHDEFYERYSAVLPVRIRWACKGDPSKALDVIRSLPQCEGRLKHMQIGRTMTFMNSKEYRLLESLKDEIEAEAASSFKRWLKMRCLRRHYVSFQRLRKEGSTQLVARRIEAAEACISELQLNSTRVAPLYALDHVYYTPVILELLRLKERAVKQLEIVTELTKITEKSENSLTLVELEMAQRLVSDARGMEDFEDRSIDICEELVVCFSMADRAAKSTVSVRQLSAAEIAQTVAALTRFKHVLPPEASTVIEQANTYIESIQAEMELYVPRISTALLLNSLALNKITGSLDGDTSTASLEAALQGINEADLVSFECKRMVSLCHLCIKLRHMIASGDDESLLVVVKKEQQSGGLLAISGGANTASTSIDNEIASKASRKKLTQKKQDSIVQLKRSASISEAAVATEETIVVVQKQSTVIFVWATEKSLIKKLISVIGADNIAATDDVLSEMKKCIDEADKFAKEDGTMYAESEGVNVSCSGRFEALLALAREILKLRTANYCNDWSLIENILRSFGLPPELYDMRSDIFYESINDYKSAIQLALHANQLLFGDPSYVGLVATEVYASLWRLKYHRILQALRIICQKMPFSEADIESGNYANVSQGSNEDNDIIQIAQLFIQCKCYVSSIAITLRPNKNKTKEDAEINGVLDLAYSLIALRYLVTAIATGSVIHASNPVLRNAGITISEESLKNEGGVLKHGLELLKALSVHSALKYLKFPLFDRELSAAKLILHIVESESELERCLFEMSVQPIPRDQLNGPHSIQIRMESSAVSQLEIVIAKMNALPKCPLSLADNVDYAVNLLEVRVKVDQLIHCGNHRVEGTQTLEDCVDYWNEACDLIDSLYIQLEGLNVADKYSSLLKSGRNRNAFNYVGASSDVKGGSTELAIINEEFCRQRFNSGMHLILCSHTVFGSVGAIHAQGDRSMEFHRALCSEMDDADSTFYAPIQPLKADDGTKKKKTTAAIFGLESPLGATDAGESFSAPVYLGYNIPLRKFVELVIKIRQSIVKDDWSVVIKFMHHIMLLEGIISVSKMRDKFQKKKPAQSELIQSSNAHSLSDEELRLIEDIKVVPVMYIEAVAPELSLIHREGNHRKSIFLLADSIEHLQIRIDESTDRLVSDPEAIQVDNLTDAIEYSAVQGQHNDDSKLLYKYAALVKATLVLVREGKVQEIVRSDLDTVISYFKKKRLIRGVTMTMHHMTIVLRFIRLHQIILKLYHASLLCCQSSPIPQPALVNESARRRDGVSDITSVKRGRSNIDSRAISVAVLRAKAENTATTVPVARAGVPSHKSSLVAMGFQGDPDLDIWILATDTLRRMRVALSGENWKEVLSVVKILRGIVSSDELEAFDSKQKEFRGLLLDQANEGYKCAIVHYLNIRMDITKTLGPVGSRGGTGYCVPTQSVDVLKSFLSEIDTFEPIAEVEEVKRKLNHLYSFRKTIFDESRVTDAPESRKTSVLSEETSLIDSFVAVEKSKNPFLPYVDPEPVKVIRAKPTSSSASQRKLSLNSAKSKTAAVLANEELGETVDQLSAGEFKFVVKTSNLVRMIEKLEVFSYMHVVSWTSAGTCKFDTETLNRQIRAVQELSTSYPTVVDDIPLIKVLNELSNLVLVAQKDKHNPAELDTELQLFSSLIQVVDIPNKLKIEMLVQIEVLQRFHLLSQFNSIHAEAAMLFEHRVFDRKIFDEFLTRLDPLVRAAGGDECIPVDMLAVIECVRVARELCWVTELHILTDMPQMIAEFEINLNKNSEFKARVGNWVKYLLSPKREIVFTHAADKDQTVILDEATVDENELALLAVEREEAEKRALKSKKRQNVKQNEVPPLEVYKVDRVVASVVAFRAVDDPCFDAKLAAMLRWQRRANLLNASWRAIFSMTEEWTIQNMHALLINHSPCVQVDGFAIRDMVSRIRLHLKEEVHPVLSNLIGCLADTLLETEQWCAVIRTAIVIESSEEIELGFDCPGRDVDVGIVLSGVELVKCIDICIFYFEQLKNLLALLRSMVFRNQHAVKIDCKYYIVGCEIRSIDKVCYTVQDVNMTIMLRLEGQCSVLTALQSVDGCLPLLCESIANHSIHKGVQRKQSNSFDFGKEVGCTVKEGGTMYDLQLTLEEEKEIYVSQPDHTDAETVKLRVSIYTAKYQGVIGHKNNGLVRVHISLIKTDAIPSPQQAQDISSHEDNMAVLSYRCYDNRFNSAARKSTMECVILYIYQRFNMLQTPPSEPAVVNETNSRALSIQILKPFKYVVNGKSVRKLAFDNAACSMLSKREEVDRFNASLQNCYLNSSAAGETQEILNDKNSGNANISLKDLLAAADINIDRLIVLLRERCFLLCTSKIGFRLGSYTPWTASWLNTTEMKDAYELSLKFTPMGSGFGALLIRTLGSHWKLIYDGTSALARAGLATIKDFQLLLPELTAATQSIKDINVTAIVDDKLCMCTLEECVCCISSAPWWSEERARAWLSNQQLALDVIVRSIDSIRLVRDMEQMVLQFKEHFLYEALPSTEKCNVNRRSIRHSMTQNSSRGSSILTNGSPDKTAAVAQSSGPMLAVAVALKKFVGRLLSQSTPCDDTSIPQGCFDLLFYANLFLPLPHREPGEAIWHRGLALQAASFMNTRLLFRSTTLAGPVREGRRASTVTNSTIDEPTILVNLETYRRAMLLGSHLHSLLVGRSVKERDILSSLDSVGHRLSPTAFINLLLYVLRSDQLPAYMQPQFALAPHAKPFSKNEETDAIIESLHNVVEAVTSFQTLRRTGIEKYYNVAAQPSASHTIIQLNASFEVALKVTVVRQDNPLMRSYLYREVLTALESGKLFIPRKSIQGIVLASQRHGCHLPGLFEEICQVMVALRRSLFVTDKTDDAMSLDEVKLKAAFQREMANAAELDSLLANELDSNAFCQLACLRATRNLCRLIQQVLHRPTQRDHTLANDAVDNLRTSWRHCAVDILNDLALGQCLQSDRNSCDEGVEHHIRRLLYNIQAVGWISDRLGRMTNCINDGAFAMLSLCRDCCELDISHVDHNADVTVDYALDVSSAWRWYTLIPPQLSYSDEYSDHNISPLSLQLSAIQQCYVEYKDICFAFTALIYQDRPDGDSTVGTDDFMEKASQQLQSLQAFCLKWIINQPSANTSSTLNLFEQHINSYNAASAAEIHRLKMRATADITNLDAGIEPASIHVVEKAPYDPNANKQMSWEKDKFLLAWAIDSSTVGQSLNSMRDILLEAIRSRFIDDVTFKLKTALRNWSANNYVDPDNELKPRRVHMQSGITSLIDVLKYTVAVLSLDEAQEYGECNEVPVSVRRVSTQENFQAQLSSPLISTVPPYLSVQAHKKCLMTGEIPQLTLKALIVLGVREAAAAGKWFAKQPLLDRAKMGTESSDEAEYECSKQWLDVDSEDEDTVEYWLLRWFALRRSSEFKYKGTAGDVTSIVIGDGEINFVVTLLENICVSRQLKQLKDFLFSLHSGELNCLFSSCCFHVHDPWASTVSVSGIAEEEVIRVNKILLKDQLRNDDNRFTMFEHVGYVLTRALMSHPYRVLLESTRCGITHAEVLFDMLISSDMHAVWALHSLSQRPISIMVEHAQDSNTDVEDTADFSKQVEVCLSAAKHELSVHMSVNIILKDVHFRHIHEVYEVNDDGHPLHDIRDASYQQMVDTHISDFNVAEDYVHTTISTMVTENTREDMQIAAMLLGQYLDFWKSRFNCQQDMSHSGMAAVQRRMSVHGAQSAIGSSNDGALVVLFRANAAYERMRTAPLSMVKDWIEVSADSLDELFSNSLSDLAYLRTDIAVERRRSIINSLALLYQFATDAYQPFHSDNAGGTVGPTIKTTVSKGSGFYSDKKNPEKVELTSWLTKVNEDSTEELLFHLRQFHFALKSIRSVLDEVKSNGAECVTTTTAITLNSGKDQQDNMDFAYDNVLGVLELSPCLREIHVVEKLLSWLCVMPPDDVNMVVEMACGSGQPGDNSDDISDEVEIKRVGNNAPSRETENWAILQAKSATEYENMLIDKASAVLQCPVMPMPLYIGMLNWRDALVKNVLQIRIENEIQKSIAVSVSAAACNGRKHIFLILADEFLKLSMLLVEMEYLMGQRQLRLVNKTIGVIDDHLPSSTLMRSSLFILNILMSVLEEDWDKVDALAAEAKGQFLQRSPDGIFETGPVAKSTKRRPSVSVFQANPLSLKQPMPLDPPSEPTDEVRATMGCINSAVEHLFDTARRIKMHNHIMEVIEQQISYDLSRSFHNSNIANNREATRSMSIHSDKDDIGSSGALHGYFQFIDFVQLQDALSLYAQKQHVNSDELTAFVQLSDFLIQLRLAIIANKWFEDSSNKHIDLDPDDFATFEGTAEKSDCEDECDTFISEIRPMTLLDSCSMPSASKASPPRPPTFPSVSYLLLNEKPDYLPRHIAAEVQRVDKEFQNHQVEMRLIQSLLSDQEYLETRDYQSITTRHLERVLVMSSIVRQRSIRTSQLYESAQKILNLRLSIKSADWSGIRCWLIELRDLAPEAEKEVSAVCAMSEANLTMHASLTQAMSQHRITGSYAKLDISQTNIVLLLSTLRAAESVPKLSADDRQVIYSAEKLKTVRLCILMADYAKLLREIEDIELRELADVAQDELFLVKRAIGFYTTLKNISNCLRTGHIVAAAGYAESRDVSLYVLNNAISSIDINDCSGSIEVYLKNAILIRDLRAAIKAGKWGSMELAELLLKSVRKNRETYEIRRKFSKYYTHHGDSSVIYASKSSNSKSHMKISRTPFQEQEIELYPTSSRRHSNSNISSAINMSDDSSDSEDDVENSLELQDEKAFHIATSLMNHSPHNLLNVDYGKIIFGRGDSDNPSSTGYGDRNVFMSPNSPSFGTFSYSDNMFRRQMSSTGDLNYKRSRLSPRKVGSPDKDNTMNVYRRSSSIAPSFLKSTPRKGSQSFSGMDLDKTLGAAMNYQPTGRTLGNDIANEESGYCDVPQETLYLTSTLNDPSLDPSCVAALLGKYMPSIVSVEVEAELTQIRDELYHRVSSAVLQKCFYSQQQLASIARGGIITTTNAAATARNVDDNLREPSGEIDTPSISVIGYVIDIDDAIHVARHLGVKSDTCRRLYLTALLIRDLRRALQEVETTGSRRRALDVFVRAQSLKTNDMFDSMAAAELEQAFLSVCGGSMKNDLLNALSALVGDPPITPQHAEPSPSKSRVFKGATPDVVGRLKTAVRNAKHVALLASDPDTRTLILASDAMLALHAAVKVGVLSKMQVCYDIAVQVTSTAQLEDDNNFSLRKRVVKELAGVRRFMLSIQMTTPLLSNKTPSSKFTMSPTAHHHTALKSAMYLQHNLTGNVSPQRDSSSTAAAVVATVAAHSEITKEIARADDRVLERIIGLFEQAVANKVSAIDATMIAKDAIDKRRVSIVVKREGDVKNLLQCVVENQDRSFTLLQRLVVSILLSILGVNIQSLSDIYESDTPTLDPIALHPRKSGSPRNMKSQKAVHLGILPSFTPLTEHNQCSSDNAVPVFLTGSSGRWLHEEAAINGFMPVLIGGDGRKGPYVSPVVHIPIDVIELAMQLLGRGFKAESILSNTEDCSEPVGSRKATRQRLKAKQGTGLSVFGEFVQMVAAITEPHIPANYLLIMQNHIAFYEAELREQSNCSALTLVKGSRTPQSHHERILQFLFESISSRATKQAKALVTVHNSGRVGKNQAERIHFTQQDFPSGGRVSSDCQ